MLSPALINMFSKLPELVSWNLSCTVKTEHIPDSTRAGPPWSGPFLVTQLWVTSSRRGRVLSGVRISPHYFSRGSFIIISGLTFSTSPSYQGYVPSHFPNARSPCQTSQHIPEWLVWGGWKGPASQADHSSVSSAFRPVWGPLLQLSISAVWCSLSIWGCPSAQDHQTACWWVQAKRDSTTWHLCHSS